MGIVYFKYNSLHLLILYPWLVPLSFTFPSGNNNNLWVCFCFVCTFICTVFLDSTYKWYMVLVFDLFDKA